MMNEEKNTFHLTDADFAATMQNAKLMLVDFWAPWCGPCRMLEPVLEDLAAEYRDTIGIYKLNVDENSQAPSKYQVRSIPTLIFFKNGQPIERLTGFMDKAALKAKIDAHIT